MMKKTIIALMVVGMFAAQSGYARLAAGQAAPLTEAQKKEVIDVIALNISTVPAKYHDRIHVLLQGKLAKEAIETLVKDLQAIEHNTTAGLIEMLHPNYNHVVAE